MYVRMKGIIMAGGKGTRLSPLTFATSKQMLPVYDKPLIYYPLSILMLCNIREILIISSPDEIGIIENLFGNGSNLGLSIQYKPQNDPSGIADGINISSSYIKDDKFALILGDNIFHGPNLYDQLRNYSSEPGATIFAYKVKTPGRYGVVELDNKKRPISIEEKPINPKSDFAITGLYFFDTNAIEYAFSLTPSLRGELEITDVLKDYMARKLLNVKILEVGTTWLDAGTPESLHDAGTYVRIIEERQGIKIACLEEIAFKNKWISIEDLKQIVNSNPNSEYFTYLQNFILSVS